MKKITENHKEVRVMIITRTGEKVDVEDVE